MIKRIKLFLSNVKYFIANFKGKTSKQKSKDIMLIIYFIFFAIILKFPLLLVKEFTLYTMEVYQIGNVPLTDLIMKIVIEIIYLLIAINYFTGAFNKKFHK